MSRLKRYIFITIMITFTLIGSIFVGCDYTSPAISPTQAPIATPTSSSGCGCGV